MLVWDEEAQEWGEPEPPEAPREPWELDDEAHRHLDLVDQPSTADLCASLRSFASDCETAWGDNAAEGGAEDLALLLAAIRDCRGALAEFATEVEKCYIAEAGEKVITVDGLGPVEVMRSTRRTKWRHDEVIASVVARVADEPGMFFSEEDGALLPFATIGHNVAGRLRACISFGAGKVAGLRAIGLDPDEFCETDEASYAVKLPPRGDL